VLRHVYLSIVVLLVVFALALGGCGDSDEANSKKLLSQAEGLIQQGKELQAEQLLTDLVARYPGTQSGATAGKQLDRMQRQRDLGERETISKVLESYQQVFRGYHAIYAEYPRSLTVLDQSEYFFDSDYLEGITPEGYQVYLWLNDDGSGFRLWCVSKKSARGYAVETLDSALVPFERDVRLKKLKARFQATAWDGKLVALDAAG